MIPIKKGLAILLVFAALSLLPACASTETNVKLCDYKNITIPDDVTVVAEEDVRLAVRMKLFEMKILARKSENESTIEYGDVVTLCISASGGAPELISITVGDEAYLPGLDEQLVGKAVHQTYDIVIDDTIYTVEIQSISTFAEVLTDELAAEFFDAPSAESVITQIETEIMEHRVYDYMYAYLLNNSMIRGMSSRSKYVQSAVDRLQASADRFGLSLEEYVETTLSTTLTAYRQSAGAFYDEYLILEALMKNECIEISDEEYMSYLQIFAEDRCIDPDTALAVYGEEVVRYIMYYEKSYSVLLQYAEY